ncbi:MAG: hypothetical protein M0Q48_04150 [Verrucomicrobia bacterium]|jgi:hypothetical protein|nr:hypothetical protein [Verrucomicrobiota bacterium]
MKKLYILLGVNALIAVAATAIVFQIHHASARALDQQRTDWTLKEAQLQASLKDLEAAIETEISNKAKMTIPQLEPSALLERFKDMQNYTNSMSMIREENAPLRNQWRDQMRETYFVLQGLRDNGDKSLDAIRAYLQSGHNVELIPNGNFSTPLYFGDEIETVPTSSRLGLMGVLINLNNSASLTLLCETMLSATNPAEICHAAQALMRANGEEFRSVCIKSLRQMLAVNTKSNIIGYSLMKVLSFLKEECGDDVSDLATAIEFVDEDGNIEISLMQKKLELMGESALPSIREAFSKPEVKLTKRMEMLSNFNEYIGINSDANSMVKLMVDGYGDSNVDAVGSVVMLMISESDSNGSKENTPSPEMIQGRLNLLNELEQSHPDDQALFKESIGFSRNILNQVATSGVQPNSEEMMKQLIQSGFMDRLGKAMIEFAKNNPEMVDEMH